MCVCVALMMSVLYEQGHGVCLLAHTCLGYTDMYAIVYTAGGWRIVTKKLHLDHLCVGPLCVGINSAKPACYLYDNVEAFWVILYGNYLIFSCT